VRGCLVRASELTGFVAALLLAASMWFYLQHIMIGHQATEAAERGIPRGNLSDLYPRWLGARELLLRHRNPYSSEITAEIQAGYYGRPLDPSRPNDPKDQQGFAYPLYVVFLLAPTITLPFPVVQIGFFWLLVATTMATVLLWLRTFEWHASWATMATLLVLTLGSFQVLQGLKLQQLSLLVSGLIAGSVALVAAGHLVAAGILLALATIKPQLVLPLVLWCWLWVSSDWPRRKRLALAFGGVMAALVAGAEVVFPGWIGQFRHALSAYREYNDGAWSVLQVLTSPRWGDVLAVLVLLATARLGWQLRGAAAGSPAFQRMTALVLAVTVLVAPKTSPYNHILLLPAVLLVARDWRTVRARGPIARVALIVATLILFWPWLAALLLTFLSWLSLTTLVEKLWIAPWYTALAIPVAVCALLALSLHVAAESGAEVKSAPASAS
jgi:Glycosyltransferase family 87